MLIDAHDAVLLDLDGVVYRGAAAVPGASEAIARLHDNGTAVLYVTNNASRSPDRVASHLRELGIQAEAPDVVTSAEAVADLMADALPAGATVLVVGAEALVDQIRQRGLVPVDDIEPLPDAVVQGYDPQLTWPRIQRACLAIQRGARWFASNGDLTIPVDGGILPGVGSVLALVGLTVEGRPTVAGKPHRPLLDLAATRSHGERPLFIGDRLDTDIEGARAAGMASALVLTGVHGKHDLVRATEARRPTHLMADMSDLLAPVRTANPVGDRVDVGQQSALVSREGVSLATPAPTDRAAQLDALWALSQACWQHDAAVGDGQLEALDLLP